MNEIINDILFVIILIISATLIIFGPTFFIIFKVKSKKLGDKYKRESKYNEIKSGISESELYATYGRPDDIIDINKSARIATYYEEKHKFIFSWYIAVEAQVSILDGTVVNVTVTSDCSNL